MKEQSHKEEMSSLLKADFERLRARGVTTTLAPGTGATAEPEPVAIEPEPVAVATPAPEPVPTETHLDERPEPSGGWLRRLLGPS